MWKGQVQDQALIRVQNLMRPVRVPHNKPENCDRGSFCTHLINNSEHLVCLHPSALCSSRLSMPQPLIVCSDFRLRSSFAVVLLPSFFFPAVSFQKELPPPILLWSTALWATQTTTKKKRTHNLYSEPRLQCEGGEGEEQALLKSPFEEGLKSAPVELAVRGYLFSSVAFVLPDGRFDLESTSGRRAPVRDASECSRAGRAGGCQPFPTCSRT